MIDLVALANELHTDPLSLGYATLITNGYDQAIADILNNTSGAGSGNITLLSMPRDDFLSAILPALSPLAATDAATQATWDRYLRVICAADTIAVGSTNVQSLLDLAASQNLLTAQQRAAIGVRVGSRAEVLFGPNTFIMNSQVASTLGRGAP